MPTTPTSTLRPPHSVHRSRFTTSVISASRPHFGARLWAAIGPSCPHPRHWMLSTKRPSKSDRRRTADNGNTATSSAATLQIEGCRRARRTWRPAPQIPGHGRGTLGGCLGYRPAQPAAPHSMRRRGKPVQPASPHALTGRRACMQSPPKIGLTPRYCMDIQYALPVTTAT
jgi:hypothetical protein